MYSGNIYTVPVLYLRANSRKSVNLDTSENVLFSKFAKMYTSENIYIFK